jgi:hypothetical protein
MDVEIGAEAALFPEKEYISGIFLAVYSTEGLHGSLQSLDFCKFKLQILLSH